MTLQTIWTAIKNFFKKIWWVVFIPIGLAIVSLFTNSKQKELKKEVKEIKKEIKQESKEVKKQESSVEKVEKQVVKEKDEASEALESTLKDKEEKNQDIAEFLPGLKK